MMQISEHIKFTGVIALLCCLFSVGTLRAPHKVKSAKAELVCQYQMYCDGVIDKIKNIIEEIPLRYPLMLELRLFMSEQNAVQKELERSLLTSYGCDAESNDCKEFREEIGNVMKKTNKIIVQLTHGDE